MKKVVILACLIAASIPGLAHADRSYREARRENRTATQDVDARMGRTIAAVTAAESRRVVPHRRATVLRNMIERMRADRTRNKRDQGFVSAGELASYNRSLDRVEREIRRCRETHR